MSLFDDFGDIGKVEDLVVKDVNRQLFQEYLINSDTGTASTNGDSKVESGLGLHDEISQFLISSNLQYMLLDDLVDEMHKLMEDCNDDAYCEIEEEVVPDFLKLMKLNDTEKRESYVNNNKNDDDNDDNDEEKEKEKEEEEEDNSMLLQELYMDITRFRNSCNQHETTRSNINGEIVEKTVNHLKKIDTLIGINQCHIYLYKLVFFLKEQKISDLVVSNSNRTSLHLFHNYYQIIQHIRKLLDTTRKANSKMLNELRTIFENEILSSFNSLLTRVIEDIDDDSLELNSIIYTILNDQFLKKEGKEGKEEEEEEEEDNDKLN